MEEELYSGREQTLIKHEILRRYLDRFAHIIGYYGTSITYVDCFSGPWNERSERFEDTSFGIAINQLKNAKLHLSEKGGRLARLRCIFLEKDTAAFEKLQDYTSSIEGIDIICINKRFEDSIKDIKDFINEDEQTFPFFLVDPTGWTGAALTTIRPLIEMKPCEVLVNFMMYHLRRFVTDDREGNRDSFRRFFAMDNFDEELITYQNTSDREDALVNLYRKRLKAIGEFEYVNNAIVLHPHRNTTYFHLVYGTRHHRGLKEFKNAEANAMEVMRDALDRIRKSANFEDQLDMTLGTEFLPKTHFDNLVKRYQNKAHETVCDLIKDKQRVTYDEIWETALQFPLTWEEDLRRWLKEWGESDVIEITGMSKRQRVPQRGQDVEIVLKNEDGLRLR